MLEHAKPSHDPFPALSLLLALCLTGSCREASTTIRGTPIQLDGPTVVPLREGSLPVVDVTLDGRGGLPFVVDSAAGVSAIDRARALELGLALGSGEERLTRGSGGGTVSHDEHALVGRLEVGGLALEGTRLPAIESEVFGELELVGVLGQDLLARLVVLFDLHRRELHLLPPEPEGPPILAYLTESRVGPGEWTQAEVELRPSPFLEIVVVGGVAGELKVDTGSMGTTFPGPVIDALGLESQGTVTSRGIDGVYETESYLLEGFDFYDFRVSCEIRRSRVEHGLLGMNVLGQFVFLLDGPGEEIWFHHPELNGAEDASGG